MNLDHYLTPLTITAAISSLIGMGLLALALIRYHLQLARGLATVLRTLWQKLVTKIAFFWLVIIVFMCISVLESGQFFNILAHDALFGLLGYAVALVFDLVAVVCMQARLEALRMRQQSGARLYLFCVFICAGMSAFGNVATSLHGYNKNSLSGTPEWMQTVAPWLGMVFPMLIIVISITADMLIDASPTDKLDVATYRAQERKRVDILTVRKEIEQDLLSLDQELAAIAQARRTAKRTQKSNTHNGQHSVSSFRWPWEKPPPTIDVEQVVAQTTASVLTQLEPQLQRFTTLLEQGQHRVTVTPLPPDAPPALPEGSQKRRSEPAHVHLDRQDEPPQSEHEPIGSPGRQPEVHTRVHPEPNGGTKRTGEPAGETGNGTMNLTKKQQAFLFLTTYSQVHHTEPKLEEIMRAVGCSKGAASGYRDAYKRTQAIQ
jgi:hypothetical protein